MRPFVVGLDLGGTDLKAALIRRDGTLERFTRRPSRTLESREAPFEAMEQSLGDLRSAAPVAIGLGCPGPITPATRTQAGATAHLPHWRDMPLGAELERRFGLPAAVDNDANVAAFAEHRVGAARGTRNSITVTLGTGIGCGIIADGRILRGSGGGAGELGHAPLGLGHRGDCPCGLPDCVEPEASAAGLLVRARAAGLDVADAPAVFAKARGGDRVAQGLVEGMCDRLGAAIATAILLLDPEVVLIGGGVAGAGEALFDPLRRAVRRHALGSHRGAMRIEPAGLGERAGVVGAGLLAWEWVGEEGDAAVIGG